MTPSSSYILTATIVLLSSTIVTQGQVSSWSIRNSIPLYGSAKHTDDLSNLQTYSGDQRSAGFRNSYGPRLPRAECEINYELLDPRNIESTREEIEQCSENDVSCFHAENSKYRTIDGSCNNLKHPSWGKSDICLRRVLPFDYGDKISFPRMSCTGKLLPNPRRISNLFHREMRKIPDRLTLHFMEWGQLLSHDLTLNDVYRTPESGRNLPIECCSQGPVFNDRCMSLPVPPNDPFYNRMGVTCIDFARTVPCHQCSAGQRVHWNQNTAYIDLSQLYGSTEKEAKNLRSGSQGMLEISYNSKSGPMLPRVSIEEICISPRHEKACYHAGDPRSNQNPFLLTAHTYLLRHHNFICQELSEMNPHWDDEKLYQEARRINIAQIQYITYNDYLPYVLGEIMEKEGINILPGAEYTKYDPELDASIIDEFSAFAGRYGHTLIPGHMSEIDPKTLRKDTIRLRDFFYTPFGFQHGQYDMLAKGMTVDHMRRHDEFITDDLRNYLYRRLYMNETAGGDLSAGSIVRGRDHGLPGYTYYLSYFFNIRVRTFDDLRKIIPEKSVDLLEELYESVQDVDVYSASLAEEYVTGGIVGPTIAAVIGQQYKRIKFGDRYWFEHGNEAGSFTPEQLLEIKRSSLSRILCETTEIMEIQRDVFDMPSQSNPIVPCEEVHKFNFLLWKE